MTAAVNCDSTIDKKSLVCGHAYTVLGTAVAPNGQRLVKLRNPWGTEQYTGPYNDNDAVNMTAEVKAALGYVSANDGVFFMRIEDFKAYVNSVVVALYRDWQSTTIQTSWKRGVEVITAKTWTLTNPVVQDVSVGMIGAQQRHMMDAACAAPEKVDNILFGVKDAAGLYVYDQEAKPYAWMTYWNGNGWQNFINLPAGTYKVVIRQGNTSNTGELPFAVQALGASAAVGLV